MKLIILLLILSSILITSCVDNTSAIQHCASLDLQYTGKALTSNIECVNVTSGELHTYSGDWRWLK